MNGMKSKFVGLDSNIFSYQFHQNPQFGPATKKIFDALSSNQLRAVTSIITLLEILSVNAPPNKIKGLEKLFLEMPNLMTFPVNHEIAVMATTIRREYKFRTPDAIQLATAKHARAKAFITNDDDLKKFKELKIILLSELKD